MPADRQNAMSGEDGRVIYMQKTEADSDFRIEFHADDYGQTLEASERILDCYRMGVLNGVSLMPGSRCLGESVSLLRQVETQDRKIALTIHLNFREGMPLSGNKAKHLIRGDGAFHGSFGKFLFMPLLPWNYAAYYQEVKEELRLQIQRCRPYFEDEPIRLDGHGHFHMLPVIFDALMDLIAEENLPVSMIRFPYEDYGLYWHCRKEIRMARPVNLVKVMILRILCRRNRKKYAAQLKGMDSFYFIGVMYSNQMQYEIVSKLLPEAITRAKAKGQHLEMLFHPGGVFEPEALKTVTSEDDRKFYSDEERNREKDAMIRLKAGHLKNL